MPATRVICRSFAPKTVHRVQGDSDAVHHVSYGYQTVATCTCGAFTYGSTGVMPKGEYILVKWCKHLTRVRLRVCHGVWMPSDKFKQCPRCGGPMVRTTLRAVTPMPHGAWLAKGSSLTTA